MKKYVILICLLFAAQIAAGQEPRHEKEKRNAFTPIRFSVLGSIFDTENSYRTFPNVNNVAGLDIGLLSVNAGYLYGLQTSFVCKTDYCSGIQFGFLAAATDETAGLQAAGLIAIADEITGMQAGALIWSGDTAGVQLGLLVLSGNLFGANAELKGVQIAAFLGGCQNVKGLQIASLSASCEKLNGVQISAVNMAMKAKGAQIGAVNYAQELSGVQIGLINIAKNSFVKVMPFINFKL